MVHTFMKKLKDYIKRILGITELQIENRRLKNRIETIRDKHETLFRMASEISKDNSLILRHINFLNSQFLVASDINVGKYEPSVVLIFNRGAQEVVKSYTFNNHTLEHIHSILEGFGKENNHIDQQRGWPKPRFRY